MLLRDRVLIATASVMLAAYGGCSDGSDEDSADDDVTGDDDTCDGDGDGYDAEACGGDDCDDGDPTIHPGVEEDESWAVEIAASPIGGGGCFSALGLDSDGAAHVAYLHSNWTGSTWVDGELWYATNASGKWSSAIVETQALRGYSSRLAVSPDDTLHIAYLDWSTGALRYLTDAGGTWDASVVDVDVEYYNQIAVGTDGAVHLVYYQGHPSTGHLHHATDRPLPWSITTVDPDDGSGSFASMALDDDGHVHIAYYYITDHELRYATDTGGTEWDVATVDSAGESTGWFSSIDVAADGIPHIGYTNGFEHDLVYAGGDGAGGWILDTVDTTSDGIDDTSTGVGEDGAVHVAYQAFYPDWPQGELRYAVGGPGAWSVETVETAAPGDSTGSYPSLVVDDGGTVHITYCDIGHDELRYATRQAGDGVDNDCDGIAW